MGRTDEGAKRPVTQPATENEGLTIWHYSHDTNNLYSGIESFVLLVGILSVILIRTVRHLRTKSFQTTSLLLYT